MMETLFVIGVICAIIASYRHGKLVGEQEAVRTFIGAAQKLEDGQSDG